MKTHIISFSLIMALFLTSVAKAQPSLLWQKNYGGSGHEYAVKTIPTSDGGFAFVGFSESNDGDVSANHGGEDLWVAKADAAGEIQWSFLYGGTDDEEGYDLVQTNDGGFMVAGWTDSFDGDVTGHQGSYSSDFWVLKLTSSGTINWAKCYGGSSDDEAKAIVTTSDGNFYISGSTSSTDGDVSGNHGTSSDFWVIKIDPAGTLLAQKCIGGSAYDEGINMALTSDGGCILAGRTSSSDGDVTLYHGGDDMLIAKLTASFVVEWAKCYGGTETEECNAIVQLSDGSYTALGYTSTHNNGDITGHHGTQGSDDFWLIHLTSNGTLSWAKCLGGCGDDQANGLAITSDGGYILTGLTNSTDGNVTGFHSGGFLDPDVWVAKVNANGTLEWQRCCGGSGQDEAFNVFELTSGVFVVTAFSYSADYDMPNNHGSADGWIFKISGSTGIETYNADMFLKLYPNPTATKLYIDYKQGTSVLYIQIMNAYGQLIYDNPHFNAISLDINEMNLSNGEYFLKIGDGKNFTAKKFIVSR